MGAAHSEARQSAAAPGGERARPPSPRHDHEEPPPAIPRNDTRSRIRAVALELFAEQGYEKTSLREIAERLGVTKAALYYHFKSKEAIVYSLLEDHFAEVDALIAWGRRRPRTASTRAAIFERYLDIVLGGVEAFRLLHQNQAAMQQLSAAKQHKGGRELFRERMGALVDLIAGPDAPLRQRVRAAAALFSVSNSCMLFLDESADTGELRAIVFDLATELADVTRT
jgi:AcrR family transcriptional regulator